MPVFTQTLQRIDASNTQDAIKKMANHIKYIQEQLEYTLLNLDSRNITEIDTNKTTITDSTGSTNIGSSIYLTGPNGESFTVGKSASGLFEFAVCGKGGEPTMYLSSSGELRITEISKLTIDGGEW